MSVIDKVKLTWNNLSAREKSLAYITGLVLVVILIVQVVAPLSTGLAKNRLEIEKLKGEIKSLPLQIERFKTLSQQKSTIETIYKNSKLNNGALSYIELLVKNRPGIEAVNNFLSPLPTKPFGGEFVQEQFKLNLKVSNMNSLIDLLKDFKNPENPLLVTKLELTRSPKNEFLTTMIEVSNIKSGKDNNEAPDL